MDAVRNQSRGFTIVEFLISFAVVGVLAAVSVVGYGAWRRSTDLNVMKTDLVTAATSMESAKVFGSSYPSELPADFHASPSSSIKLTQAVAPKPTGPHYSGLNEYQNGVLFTIICQQLIDEGLGKAVTAGGTVASYVQQCGNWNRGGMSINGYDSRYFPTPVKSDTLPNLIKSVPTSSAWDLNRQKTEQNFYHELDQRFLAEGGHYPILYFYDSWATPTNGGLMKQNLPGLDPETPAVTPGKTFCIEASPNNQPGSVWHITPDRHPTEGPCD